MTWHIHKNHKSHTNIGVLNFGANRLISGWRRHISLIGLVSNLAFIKALILHMEDFLCIDFDLKNLQYQLNMIQQTDVEQAQNFFSGTKMACILIHMPQSVVWLLINCNTKLPPMLTCIWNTRSEYSTLHKYLYLNRERFQRVWNCSPEKCLF